MGRNIQDLADAVDASDTDMGSIRSATGRSGSVSIGDWRVTGVFGPQILDPSGNPVAPGGLQCGLQYTARLLFNNEGQYFEDIKNQTQHFQWRSTGDVIVAGQIGHECFFEIFTMGGSGTIEGKLQDGFNTGATGYNVYQSQIVDCSA